MKQVLQAIANRYGKPTAEDYQLAEEQVEINPQHWGVSQDPEIRKSQIAIIAGYFAAKRWKASQFQPVKTKEDIETEALNAQIEHDYRVSTAMMGAFSKFAKVSLYAPSTKPTAVVRYFKDVFPYQKKQNCLLLGETGAGKTFGAVGYVAQHGEVGNVAFITAYKMGELVNRRAFEQLDWFEKVRFLIVDDLGISLTGYRGEDFTAFFENLFATRHQHNRPTLITSNGSKEQIRDTYGERFVSRFSETGEIFITPDKDMRRSEA